MINTFTDNFVNFLNANNFSDKLIGIESITKDAGIVLKEDIWICSGIKSNELRTIFNTVCKTLHINTIDALKKNRKTKYVWARYYYFKIARSKKDLSENYIYSLYAIGSFVCRNHATVLHGIKQISNIKGEKEKFQLFLKQYEKINQLSKKK